MKKKNLFSSHSSFPARLTWKWDQGFEKLAGQDIVKQLEGQIGPIDHMDAVQKAADQAFGVTGTLDEEEAGMVKAEEKQEKESDEKENPKPKVGESLPELLLSDDLSEAERQLRKEIWEAIKKQHQYDEEGNPTPRAYHLVLKGEWVEATLENRLKKQQEVWERMDQLKNADVRGVSDIDHFRHQERYYREKKLERDKQKGETRDGKKQKQEDEAELWTIQSKWEFKKPFVEAGAKLKDRREKKDKKTWKEKREERRKNRAGESKNEPPVSPVDETIESDSGVQLASLETSVQSPEATPEAENHSLEKRREAARQWKEEWLEGDLGNLQVLYDLANEYLKNPEAQKGSVAESLFADPDMVAGLQMALEEKGVYSGPSDGQMNDVVLSALSVWIERRHQTPEMAQAPKEVVDAKNQWQKLSELDYDVASSTLKVASQVMDAYDQGKIPDVQIISEFINLYSQNPKHNPEILSFLQSTDLETASAGLALLNGQEIEGEQKWYLHLNLFSNRLKTSLEVMNEAENKKREEMTRQYESEKQFSEKLWEEIQPLFNDLVGSPESPEPYDAVKGAAVFAKIDRYLQDPNNLNERARMARGYLEVLATDLNKFYSGKLTEHTREFAGIFCSMFGADLEELNRIQQQNVIKAWQTYLNQVTPLGPNALEVNGKPDPHTAAVTQAFVTRYAGLVEIGTEFTVVGTKENKALARDPKVKAAYEITLAESRKHYLEQANRLNELWLKERERNPYRAADYAYEMSQFGYTPAENGPVADPEFEQKVADAAEARKAEHRAAVEMAMGELSGFLATLNNPQSTLAAKTKAEREIKERKHEAVQGEDGVWRLKKKNT